jgi:hypothetical protein
MLCTIADDFCRALTSQSMLWRHCHVAEFVVWNLLAGEVHCRLHLPLKNCVKCWPYQTAWQCVTHRTLKLSVLQYQVSVVFSVRLFAVPCPGTGFPNRICIVNVPVFFMCDLEIHIRMGQFILWMASTTVRSTFCVLCLYLNLYDFH